MELLLPEWGLIFWTVLGIFLIPWLIALISILRNDFKDSITKLTWVVVVIFLPVIGSLLYFIIGRSQRIIKN